MSSNLLSVILTAIQHSTNLSGSELLANIRPIKAEDSTISWCLSNAHFKNLTISISLLINSKSPKFKKCPRAFSSLQRRCLSHSQIHWNQSKYQKHGWTISRLLLIRHSLTKRQSNEICFLIGSQALIMRRSAPTWWDQPIYTCSTYRHPRAKSITLRK